MLVVISPLHSFSFLFNLVVGSLFSPLDLCNANNTLFEDLRIFLRRSSEPSYISGPGDLTLFMTQIRHTNSDHNPFSYSDWSSALAYTFRPVIKTSELQRITILIPKPTNRCCDFHDTRQTYCSKQKTNQPLQQVHGVVKMSSLQINN